eukprot:4931936-Pyramimonas_sp.AAC.1
MWSVLGQIGKFIKYMDRTNTQEITRIRMVHIKLIKGSMWPRTLHMISGGCPREYPAPSIRKVSINDNKPQNPSDATHSYRPTVFLTVNSTVPVTSPTAPAGRHLVRLAGHEQQRGPGRHAGADEDVRVAHQLQRGGGAEGVRRSFAPGG